MHIEKMKNVFSMSSLYFSINAKVNLMTGNMQTANTVNPPNKNLKNKNIQTAFPPLCTLEKNNQF